MDLFPMFLDLTWPFTILCLIHAFVNCDGVDTVTSTYNNPKIKVDKNYKLYRYLPKKNILETAVPMHISLCAF